MGSAARAPRRAPCPACRSARARGSRPRAPPRTRPDNARSPPAPRSTAPAPPRARPWRVPAAPSRDQQELSGRLARLEVLVRLATLLEPVAGADADFELAAFDQLEELPGALAQQL